MSRQCTAVSIDDDAYTLPHISSEVESLHQPFIVDGIGEDIGDRTRLHGKKDHGIIGIGTSRIKYKLAGGGAYGNHKSR